MQLDIDTRRGPPARMSVDPKKPTATAIERSPSTSLEVRTVQNVALADATAKSAVSPWSPSMYKVEAVCPP